ncbi:MAG: GHKL domain-containing protein [Lachnospiraceae bacterium]|nr:GHKL domain-containing protein [Lachnospiraceae bacterium]
MADAMFAVTLICIFGACLKVNRIQKEMAHQESELDLYQTYAEAYQELIDEIRTRQHAYKNQIDAVMSIHITAKDLEELIQLQRDYIGEIKSDEKYYDIVTNCNHPVLAGYLYHRCILIEEQQIHLEYKICVDKASCSVPIHEIIEMLGILIDNAQEQLVTNMVEERLMYMALTEDAEKFVVEICNASSYFTNSEMEKFYEKGYSTKGEKRGLGLYRVKQIVKKYKLALITSCKEMDNRTMISFQIICRK